MRSLWEQRKHIIRFVTSNNGGSSVLTEQVASPSKDRKLQESKQSDEDRSVITPVSASKQGSCMQMRMKGKGGVTTAATHEETGIAQAEQIDCGKGGAEGGGKWKAAILVRDKQGGLEQADGSQTNRKEEWYMTDIVCRVVPEVLPRVHLQNDDLEGAYVQHS